jgi:hypothetical protein
VPTGVKNCSEDPNRGLTKEIKNMVGIALLVLNIQVELFQVCRTFLWWTFYSFPCVSCKF